jgi:hypothetical protein
MARGKQNEPARGTAKELESENEEEEEEDSKQTIDHRERAPNPKP